MDISNALQGFMLDRGGGIFSNQPEGKREKRQRTEGDRKNKI